MKLPHSEEAEEALIATIGIDGTLIHDAIQHQVTTDSFHGSKARIIYGAILTLASDGREINEIGVIEAIKEAGQIRQCGMAEVVRIFSAADTISPYKNSRDVVLAKAAQRTAIGEVQGILKKLEDDYATQDAVDQAVAPGIARATNALKSAAKARHTKDIINDAKTRAKLRIEGKASQNAISWGLPLFERLATPIEQELVFVAARPSIGKSSLANNIAWANIKQGRRVASFLLETSDVSQVEAFAASDTRVSVRGLRDELPEDQRAYLKRLDTIEKDYSHLFKTYDRDTSLSAIESRIRVLGNAWHPELILVDYLQLIRHNAAQRSRADEVGEITRTLADLVKTLGCPIICMSQLVRDVVRTGREPVLSDLRDSGSIEADANRVVFIERHNRTREGAEQPDGELLPEYHCSLIQAKLRDGPKCRLDVRFLGPSTTFKEYDTYEG